MKISEWNWPFVLTALLSWISVSAAAFFAPRLTRPDLFFAVTVKPDFRQSAAGREILRRYDHWVITVSFLSFLLMGLMKRHTTPMALPRLLAPVYLELVGLFFVFLAARQRALAFHVEPTGEREASLQPRAASTPGGWLALAGPFLILATVIFILYARWDEIPAQIPVHWGISGVPNGWGTKSLASVFGCAAIGSLACALMATLRHGIVHGVRRVHGSGARGQREERFVRVFSFFLLAVEYWLALLLGSLSLVALRSDPAVPLPALVPILLGEVLLVGAVFLIAWRTGQGGWRLGGVNESKVAPGDAPIGDRTPDECWKLGVFYCNPNDPALFVEKRFGVGWTINMSNPKALFVFGGIVLFAIASVTVGLLATR